MSHDKRMKRLPPRPGQSQSPDLDPLSPPAAFFPLIPIDPSQPPTHKKNALSFEECKPSVEGTSHKRATSDFSMNPGGTGEESPVHSAGPRFKHPVGSVYHLASALTPNCESEASSTNNSSLVSGSVEIIVSELDNPTEEGNGDVGVATPSIRIGAGFREDWGDLAGPSERPDDSDMSETEQIIRNIIKERSSSKPEKGSKEKPLDLHECISTIMTQRKEESKKLEDQRWQLKQHILEVISQVPVPSKDPPLVSTPVRKPQNDKLPCPVGVSFTGELVESEESVPEFNEFVSEVKVTPYQRSVSTEKKMEPSYLKEVSFREKSPKPTGRSPRDEGEENKEGGKRFGGFKPANRKIIKNAVATVCLPGDGNRKLREQVLEVIDQHSPDTLFVIAFKGTLGRHDFAALYAHDLLNGVLVKVLGPTHYPPQVTSTHICACYKYDSTAKEFRQMTQRRLSLGTDAVSIMVRKG